MTYCNARATKKPAFFARNHPKDDKIRDVFSCLVKIAGGYFAGQ
jgi:hypothetical protein